MKDNGNDIPPQRPQRTPSQPAAIALVRAVEREIDHLTLAASRGRLDDLEPLAIPHGPLLANLHALHESLRTRNSLASTVRSRRAAAVFTPIPVDFAITPALPPRYSVDERISRALMRRAVEAAAGPAATTQQSVNRPDASIGRVDGCGGLYARSERLRRRTVAALYSTD